MKHRRFFSYAWLLPFMLFVGDAHAWGLVTHTYFAHALIWACPLLDPKLRRIITHHSALVMAGACLPDLGLMNAKMTFTHGWATAHHLLKQAETEEELALAIGYTSHLYVDVIAHHHFVPAHEAMWFEKGLVAHIASEWAMDAYLTPYCRQSPSQLLKAYREPIHGFMRKCFPQHASALYRAIDRLGFWDKLLRLVKIPHLLCWCIRRIDKRLNKHFDYYIQQTERILTEFERVLSGHHPGWAPENHVTSATELSAKRLACLEQLSLFHPGPIPYFVKKTSS